MTVATDEDFLHEPLSIAYPSGVATIESSPAVLYDVERTVGLNIFLLPCIFVDRVRALRLIPKALSSLPA